MYLLKMFYAVLASGFISWITAVYIQAIPFLCHQFVEYVRNKLQM